MPVTPQVSTPPRPLVLNEPPNTLSILSLSGTVTSSRHKLVHAIEFSPVKPVKGRGHS
jgi:hypothetical protein